MLLFILIFATVTALYRQRGWISPLIGIAAVLTQFVMEALIWAAISFFSDISAQYINQYAYPVLLGISLYAALSTILVYFVLSRMLPKIDYRTTTKVSRIPYRVIGYLIVSGAILFTPYLVYLGITTGDREFSRAVTGVVILAIFTAWPCFKLGKLQNRAASRWRLLESRIPPILYLRSFALETDSRQNVRLGMYWGSKGGNFDEILESAIVGTGVLVALGDPEDYLPTAGAVKVYPGDDRWQEYVSQLSEVARAIFIVEGGSHGLSWELEFVRASNHPDKVYLFTAPRNFRKAYRRKHKSILWNAFRDQMEQAGFTGLGDDPGSGAIIKFDRNWSPKLLASGLNRAKAYKAILEKNLSGDQRPFDYSSISDLIFTGLADTDIVEHPIGLKRGLQMAAVSLAGAALSTLIVVGAWQYLDKRSLLPLSPQEGPNVASKKGNARSIVYKGSTIPYALSLPGHWRSLPPSGELDLLFEDRSGQVGIGVIAEDPDVVPAGFDTKHYISIVVNRANSVSTKPLEVLQRDSREIDGQNWSRVRYRGVFNGLELTYVSAVHVSGRGIFQILGWTTNPEKYDVKLENAMQGFSFPHTQAASASGAVDR